MTINVMPEVQLSVGLTNPNDDGQGKALLDPKTMLLLNISLGDLVMIEGKRQTVAKFCQTPIQDWNQCKIMIDHFTRFNARCGYWGYRQSVEDFRKDFGKSLLFSLVQRECQKR